MMKEEMLKVLNDESLTTNEAKVDAMAKAMATLVIPKDKFNEESAKRKKAEEDLANLSAKITQEPPKEEPKQDERVVGLENEIKNLRIESNRAKVEKIFSQAGLEEKDYKEDLDQMDLSDESRALAYANSVVKFLNANTEKVKKETQASLLNDTPKPIVGGTNASTATMDKLVKEFGEAVKSKDQVAQARLMRQIQEERAKTSSNIK
jgi:hypothetical protein